MNLHVRPVYALLNKASPSNFFSRALAKIWADEVSLRGFMYILVDRVILHPEMTPFYATLIHKALEFVLQRGRSADQVLHDNVVKVLFVNLTQRATQGCLDVTWKDELFVENSPEIDLGDEKGWMFNVANPTTPVDNYMREMKDERKLRLRRTNRQGICGFVFFLSELRFLGVYSSTQHFDPVLKAFKVWYQKQPKDDQLNPSFALKLLGELKTTLRKVFKREPQLKLPGNADEKLLKALLKVKRNDANKVVHTSTAKHE
ncbi:hypothetical protein L596_009493 [Steinernema carpocapsae]|uniref:Uncharacterized protein n=2 Tax=Steinernema carpocapsae TaxID=34508 RepID=A0A4U5PGU0_STECR|nr:hypothetical protein L596_009493 [Steinernema carpocapsae]